METKEPADNRYSDKPCRGCGKIYRLKEGKTGRAGEPIEMEPMPLAARGLTFCKLCTAPLEREQWRTTANIREGI